MVHAEANAVATACLHGVSFRGCTIYVTAPPCSQCAGLLIQAGIARVVWSGTLRDDWRESVEVALAMFREVGIECAQSDALSQAKRFEWESTARGFHDALPRIED